MGFHKQQDHLEALGNINFKTLNTLAQGWGEYRRTICLTISPEDTDALAQSGDHEHVHGEITGSELTLWQVQPQELIWGGRY